MNLYLQWSCLPSKSKCCALIRNRASTSITGGKTVKKSAHVRGNGGEERGRGWRSGGEE